MPVFIASQLPRDLGRVVGRPRWRNSFLRDSLSTPQQLNGNDAILKSREAKHGRDWCKRHFFVGFGFPSSSLDSFLEWSLDFLAVSFIKFTCVRKLRHRKYDELDGVAANWRFRSN